MPRNYSFDKSIIALDWGADHPVVCNCIKIERSDMPPFRAVFVQSIAAALSDNSSLSNNSGSILTLALRTLPSPTGLRFATLFPSSSCGRCHTSPLWTSWVRTSRGPALGGPLFGPPGGPLLGPPGGPRLGPDAGRLTVVNYRGSSAWTTPLRTR